MMCFFMMYFMLWYVYACICAQNLKNVQRYYLFCTYARKKCIFSKNLPFRLYWEVFLGTLTSVNRILQNIFCFAHIEKKQYFCTAKANNQILQTYETIK